ncbi:MAG: helix-turn-helix domain-containing protein [Coriobacteriia bacterium]
MEELWDIARVATYLGVTERTVYNKVRAGELPAVKVGRLWRVRASDLEAWLARSGRAPSVAAAAAGALAFAVAEPGPIPPRAELEALLAPVADQLERRLMFVGLLSGGVEALGWPAPVVVGGHAVEFYTAGSYATVDIDLAGDSEPVGQVLDAWRFQREGRHWYDEELGLVVEVPGSLLGPDEKQHSVELRIGPMIVRIIGIEDLVIDRLAACVHWKHTESCEWAVRLLRAADEIDPTYLRRRAVEEQVADGLERALKEAGTQ